MSCDHRKGFSGGWYWMVKTLFSIGWWTYGECDYCKRRLWFWTSVLRKQGYGQRLP